MDEVPALPPGDSGFGFRPKAATLKYPSPIGVVFLKSGIAVDYGWKSLETLPKYFRLTRQMYVLIV